MFKSYLLLFILLTPYWDCKAQINNQNQRQIEIKKINTSIQIDGKVDSIWSITHATTDFVNHRPSDVGLAKSQTEVKMLYNDQFIYILAKAYHSHQEHIIQNLKRDDYFSSDGFGVLMDPINKQTNGFFFGINSRGSQAESLITSSGGTDWNWDAKWYSRVTHHDTYWIVEMAIPFFTLRYNAKNTAWGINFLRNDLGNNMFSTWTSFPANFNDLDLGYTGSLSWEDDIPEVKKKIAMVPSMTTTTGKDFEQEKSTEWDFTPSLDAKIAVTSSLNLDLTINPDFSQIEVDRQVTNLSRFSLFFPERRTFFLENSDLFTGLGRSQISPFFSRRIGLSSGKNIPIKFGARLTGNLTEKLRIGMLNAQTERVSETKAQNYGLLTLKQRILKRSSVSGIFVNRQQVNTDENDYNRVVGTEFNYSTENGFVSGDIKYYKSFSDGIKGSNDFVSGSMFLNSRGYRVYTQFDHVGDNYLADVGFTPRLFNYDALRDTTVRVNYQRYNFFGTRDYRPASGPIVFHGPRIQSIIYTNDGNQFNERYSYIGYEIDFADQSQFDFSINSYTINLLFPTNFLDADSPLPARTYSYYDLVFDWDSDPRKLFAYGTVFTSGTFFNGKRTGLRSYLQYRFQPWLRLRLDHNYNQIDLEEFGNEDIHLVGLRSEVSFSNNVFWTTFLQFNTQSTNFNINSRFQWRFAPLSDLFVVYTDNYFSDTFERKNRFTSIKINYWLNF
ncbi:DUF5916 domain-containing protein [Reichenbachiella sp.]|uniref:DUF5916 domain-containing protein n=1 Tax=Reichenbachiella sp. TaxID=2184521 RepID=UPI003298E683